MAVRNVRRFPVPPGRGFKPNPNVIGTRLELAVTPDAYGIARTSRLRQAGALARTTPTRDDVHGRPATMTFLGASRGALVEVSDAMAVPGFPPSSPDRSLIVGTEASATFADNAPQLLGPNRRAQACDAAAGRRDSFGAVLARFVDCLEIAAAFETIPSDILEPRGRVMCAHWSAGQRLFNNNSEQGS